MRAAALIDQEPRTNREPSMKKTLLTISSQSVPCAILQASAFVHFNDGQTLGDIAGQYDFASLSVAVSCVTIGFLVSTLSFDKDVDAKSRRTMGEFYGMIPDGAAWRFVR